MFEGFIQHRFNPENITILGKAYSSNNEVISSLTQKGVRVIQPHFYGSSFDEEHIINCRSVVESITNNKRVIIIDDGAELIKSFTTSDKKVWFAIEQTSSGFRKLETEEPDFPIVNVARSTTKLVQESPLIARLCFERINDYLLEKAINNPSILIIGLGPIGEAILQIFKQNHYSVSGFDIKHGHSDVLSSIKELDPNVIIGATGFEILTRKELDSLTSNKPLHLISVSSSDREFPVAAFRSGDEIHKDVIYKNITFVNNGFPITFKGNKNELTPIEIEKTICLLAGSVLYGITNNIKTKGLVNVADELEDLIN